MAGPHYNFEELIQAFKRIHRFLQTDEVLIDFVFAESQAKVRAVFLAKLAEHEALMQRMSALVRQYGLSETDPEETLRRSIGVARRELRGPRWTAINNDAVEEAARQPDNTYGFTLTSVPFSSQYEYTPSYNDFGHTDDEAHFWRQQDFLTPNLFRTLQPGRCLVVHVKDRVRPGGYDGRSFQTIAPFHCNAVLHYMRHGFALMSIRTLVTDVVRENFQTGTSARLTRSATRRRLFDALQPDEPEAVPA